MDTTPEYIKKCEKSEEIQAKYRLKNGDTYAQFHAGKYESRLYHEATGGLRWVSLKAIWLPTQDRLQEMVSLGRVHPPFLELLRWHDWAIDSLHNFDYWDSFKSMEQLWLAFVMKERFGKVWDSTKEEWVKWR